MQKRLNFAVIALCSASLASAQIVGEQTDSIDEQKGSALLDEAAFTFTEAQLGEDEDMSQNVTILGSNNNQYASQVGYAFSPTRFRYRALSQKYNNVYINGMEMNDMETGQFRFSLIGGLNNQTRNQEYSLPFESNGFNLSGMGGANNYNFRSGHMATGHRLSVAGANRNYTLRGMYTYNSGFNNNGWAFSASLTYRWANRGYVPGTFYNALSYFFGVEKILNDNNRISFSTWGNPTERAGQGGATDESYWLANSNFYNPYWGYQNGKKRNSRIVTDFAPSALLTWDSQLNDKMKLTTTLGGRYSMYKSTKLNYNNADNPQPDYWKLLPSSMYDVFNPANQRNNDYSFTAWHEAVDYFTRSEANRQIDFDQLIAANRSVSEQGKDAMYYIQAKRNDALNFQLNSVLNYELDKARKLNIGVGLGTNHGRHYQTMEDLLGATAFHNINTYAQSKWGSAGDKVQYDLNNPNASVGEGDVFGYDYYLNVNKANVFATYVSDINRSHLMIGGRFGYTGMERDGKMRNGLAADYSYGKSGMAHFTDGGVKVGFSYNLGKGNAFSLGAGIESRAPLASTAFEAPEVNNNFVKNLRNELDFSSEFSYRLVKSWIALSLNAYYNYMGNVTEWQNFYFDDVNSFTYVSMTGIQKEAYGVELGAKIKLLSMLDLKLLGHLSEAKYKNNADVRYMLSTEGTMNTDKVYSEGMRESGTPLTATSIGLSYHANGWFIDLSANWYDRIYLSWSPCLRYEKSLQTQGLITSGVDANGNLTTIVDSPDQQKGHGGWMVDASIGKNIYLKHGSLSINLSLTNLLNNVKICTGGYEQSRSSYTTNADGSYSGARVYSFLQNPKKFYAYGTNGLLNITWKF